MMTADPAPPTLPYEEHAPSTSFRDYVACFWRSHALDQPRFTLILPDGCIDLIWQAGREPFIAGPMTVPAESTTLPGTVTLGVRFKPGAAAALIGVSAAELRDSTLPLREIWPGAGRQKARDRALAVSDSLSLPDANEVVRTLLSGAPPQDRFIADACRWLAQRPGEPAAAVVASSGVSERQARRRFQDHVGYGPKTLQRILRMQRVLWLLSRPVPSRSLASLAHAAGFADQAHLTREMRALTWQLPTALAAGNPHSAVADLFKTPLA
jgi:AraC-like DNA-binding protein